jgi:hypothetical protein
VLASHLLTEQKQLEVLKPQPNKLSGAAASGGGLGFYYGHSGCNLVSGPKLYLRVHSRRKKEHIFTAACQGKILFD